MHKPKIFSEEGGKKRKKNEGRYHRRQHHLLVEGEKCCWMRVEVCTQRSPRWLWRETRTSMTFLLFLP